MVARVGGAQARIPERAEDNQGDRWDSLTDSEQTPRSSHEPLGLIAAALSGWNFIHDCVDQNEILVRLVCKSLKLKFL